MKKLLLLATLIASSLVSSLAHAQPMMIDPSRMSGIPRPDPQVPAHTITVRLIRGELANRLTGVEVALADEGGNVVTAKTDEQGRATFANLTGAKYQARATDGIEELTSQDIELPADVGVRVMLVFKANTTNAADGIAKPDKTLPAGTIRVRAVGEGGEPVAGLPVVLGHMRQGENGVSELKGKTDGKGEARFDGLDYKPNNGYGVEVTRDGARFDSKPFRLQNDVGSTVILDAQKVSHDLSALHVDANSHLIFDIQDDVVQVIEVLHIVNSSSQPIDPPGGLHLPLPQKSLQSAPGPQNPPTFAVNGKDAVLRGPIPPGDTPVQLMFLLAYDSGTIEFQQQTPIAFEQMSIVTEKIDGLDISGNSLERNEREVQGRKLLIFAGPGVKAGEIISLRLTGLPHANPLWRWVTAILSIIVVVGFGIYAAGGKGQRARLTQLEAEREHLLNELVALEQKQGSDKRRDAKKEELTARLAKIYRELDDVVR